MFGEVYKGKTILVTGHTGFKGSWLSTWLNMLGAKVVGYGLAPKTQCDNFVVSKLDNEIIDIRGDVRDKESLQKVFASYSPEIVFHLAAQPIVRLSYEEPVETYEVNVNGTLNILECMRKYDSVRLGIMITTDKCYENKEQIWGYRECDPIGGYDPYSASKGCAEILISSYRNSFFNPRQYRSHQKAVSSVRAGNVIGGGDWSVDRLIPDCIKALQNDEIIEIRNPHSVRPWQHVLEPLSGYLLLGEKMLEDGEKYSSSWNFGPDFESIISVEELVNKIIKFWGKGEYFIADREEKLHEASQLNLDCTKAKVNLGWRPILDIEKALEYTVEWYKHFKDSNALDICKRQIEEYGMEIISPIALKRTNLKI